MPQNEENKGKKDLQVFAAAFRKDPGIASAFNRFVEQETSPVLNRLMDLFARNYQEQMWDVQQSKI